MYVTYVYVWVSVCMRQLAPKKWQVYSLKPQPKATAMTADPPEFFQTVWEERGWIGGSHL